MFRILFLHRPAQRRQRRGHVGQIAVVLAVIVIAIIISLQGLGREANTSLEDTAEDVGNPTNLAERHW